ncbi:MAG: Rieske 2Fe-2S domain-containing protein, partial [Verrucomicrobiota bacterium]
MNLPRNCTFNEQDWRALAPFWYPVAFSHEVKDKPFAAKLLDERLVVFRINGQVTVARDLCLHRGAPLSAGWIEGNEIVCGYHGFRYDATGQCVCIPAHPGAAISPKLKLPVFPAQERYGLIWTRLVDNGPSPVAEFDEWYDSNFLQILPDSVDLNASAGRQMEGFLDVSHFAFVHVGTFGELDNREVPGYPVELTPAGFRADYVSTVSNYSRDFKHLNPPGFEWRRLFETWLPFTAKLTVFFPNGGQLHILNAASPVSARQ